MRRLRILCPWLVVLVVGMVLSGCARGAQRLSAADEAATEQLLVHTYERVFGTIADYNAISYLVNHAAEVDIAACMSKDGYRYNSQWVKNFAGPVTASDNWLAPLDSEAVSTALRDSIEVTRRGFALDKAQPEPGTPEATPKYQAALEPCVRNAHEPSPEKFRPALAYSMLGQFRSITDSVEARPEWTSGYRQCMADHGWTSSGAYDTYSLVESHRPAWNDIPAPGEPETPAWKEFLTYEHRAFSDDIACRSSYHQEAIAEIAPLLQSFISTHQDELARLDADWAGVREQATAAGWPAGD